MGYQYIYDFDICTMLFFGLTIFFYLYQKRLRNLQDGIFTAMLICSMIAVAFDFISAAIDYNAMAYPVWLIYLVNMLFIFGMQSCLPLFFLYSVAMAGRFNRFSTKRRIICAVPYAVTMLLLLLSPFTGFGICTVDASHIYQHGLTHSMLYINMGIYVAAGLAVLLWNVRTIQRAKRNVILLFAALLFVAMALQLIFPRYLLTASATALALTSVFYVLQSPADQINPQTGAFSRTLLPSLLQDYVERGRTYTLLLFSLRSFDESVRLYGDNAGDELLRAYAEELAGRFPREIVVYMDTAEFIVLHLGVLSRGETELLYERTPSSVVLPGGRGAVPVTVSLGAVPYAGGKPLGDLSIADRMLKEMRTSEGGCVLYADEEYTRACAMALSLETSIGDMLSKSGVLLSFSRILALDGAPVAEEVHLCPNKDAVNISQRQFLQAVCQGGHAWEYYKTLFAALCARSEKYSADMRLCTALLPAAFLREDAPNSMAALTASLGFEPGQILFAVGESEVAASAMLAENVKKLAELGFAVMIDTFAEGYTDMSLILSLPLSFARLHEGFTKNAAASAKHAKLLNGLIGVLEDIGIAAVCPGVNCEAERRAALDAGARLLQGSAAEQTIFPH